MPAPRPTSPYSPPVAPATAPGSGFLKGSGGQEALALPVAVGPAVDDGLSEDEAAFERVNEAQVRYRPMSKVNPTGAVIPASMAGPTAEALRRLNERVGDIDTWICRRLDWTREELAEYLTSEQVDGAALAIDAGDRGEGLILADQTGFGKGRILAAAARASIVSGRSVIFLTEKENLFSDIWRDIRDIGSEALFGRPFMMNDGSRIVDTASANGDVVVPAWKKAEADRIMRSGRLPEGCRIVLATYSQFNRKGTRKTDFLESVAPGSHLVCDEAHNFVGADSTTSKTVGAAVALAAASTFSSATFARDVGNLVAYSTVFPWLQRIGGLEEFTPGQRRALAEESTRLATLGGRIIRREHDLSNMLLRVREDEPRVGRNEVLSDALSPILSAMARLARRVDALLMERNETNKEQVDALMSADERKGARELWFTANFGSRLNAMEGQFLTALLVDAAVEECVESLLKGEKPVVVIESTMESLMRELSKEADEAPAVGLDIAEDGTDPVLPADAEQAEAPPPGAARPPTFREALSIMADRLLRVSVRRGPENAKEQVFLDRPDLVEMHRVIKEAVSTFPEISLSPIDDIRDRIEAEGRRLHAEGRIAKPWVADEISARSMRVQGGRYVPMPPADRNTVVARFVNGATQALVLTNAASTGLSIHDSEKFTDHGRRHMVEMRAPRNVIQRIQMWGRVFRRGQRTEPRFTTLSTGLPYQSYELAIANRKVQELCASVTGSGDTMTTLAVPDPIDLVGNEVAHELLLENQSLADAMGISLNVDKEEADKELYFVGKLLRRLPLIEIEAQRRVFAAFLAAYEDRLRSGGASHGLGRDLEGRWTPVTREILEAGDGSDDPVNGGDVTVTTIRSTRAANPMPSADVNELVLAARARRGADRPYAPWVAAIGARKAAVLEAALPSKRYRTVEQALRTSEDNSVKRARDRLSAMASVLAAVAPGAAACLAGDDGEAVEGVIIDVRPPALDEPTSPRNYEIVYALPGDERPRAMSLDALVRNPAFNLIVDQRRAAQGLLAFDAAPKGTVDVERKILDGNGIGAVLAARRMGVGTRVGYVDSEGRRRTGVLLPKSAEKKLAGQPGRTTLPEVALAVLRAGGRLKSDQARPGEGVQVSPAVRTGGIVVTVPFAKRAAKAWETEGLVALTGNFEGDWRGREARVPPERALPVLRELARLGCEFHFEARHRRLAVERSREHAGSRIAERAQRGGPGPR